MVTDYNAMSILDTPEIEEEEIVANPRISVAEASETYGKFVIGPLDPGYGVTLGNPLRRVLYNSLSGSAITWVQIEGILHEYSNIENVKEEVSEILLNVKNLRIRTEGDFSGQLRLVAGGEGKITASDISPSSEVTVVNTDQHIATLDSADAEINMVLNVDHGKGYKVAESSEGHAIGVIPIDAVFTPVRKVNYTINQTRVGQRTDFEELHFEVWTDGSKYPVEAVIEAANILVNQFFLFTKAEDAQEGSDGVSMDIPAEHYNMTVEELELSSRTLNCLKRAALNKVGEVMEKSKSDLLEIRNFGEKSYRELYDKFRELEILPEHLDPELNNNPEGQVSDSDAEVEVDEG
ncbi:MAG: DNA-directed RNA polymerase subunit alpha [SAR202 cluster bacterium]|jgi:DNA-directed RNA polymerase subunit alpha|nr:MAG: DNA-directed RNA polymerase subunit alpha [SAR202 cluster bacterium]MEC7734445.1 DNA-directed RNA polymerase subunit alpha [Chloroflexota bacterium]MED5409794.1 DNA-directed RNA polymerase subunit alpha [Chloroflexota bacterium]MEE3345682.1 DNA-directed RNA polymerase subunit alpha [Chloroflexota bacterium]|tara:strand:- start:904 stop:1953 length:1050 start_codon:yes stop_codon:yes gene_type:complete